MTLINKKIPVVKTTMTALKNHFKACLVRASFLRNQGYILPEEYKAIRNRILKEQEILIAFNNE